METSYLSTEEVAKKLHVGVETIRRYLRSGKMKGLRMSAKCWRILPSDLFTFIHENKS